MIPFAIVGIRRTGTTLLRTTLNEHPDVHCHGEVFTFRRRFGTTRGEKCHSGYRRYIQQALTRRIRDIVDRERLVDEFIDQLFSNDPHKAVGLKMMITQHEIFPTVIPNLKNRNTRFVHVVRENVLKTLVSRAAKKVTGKSHTTTAGGKTIVTLREHRLLADLQRFENENRQWEQLTDGMPYLRVSYEDFVQDKDLELNRILEFLELEPQSNLTSPLAKGNSDDLKEIIANYEAVASLLKGTRFERCLHT